MNKHMNYGMKETPPDTLAPTAIESDMFKDDLTDPISDDEGQTEQGILTHEKEPKATDPTACTDDTSFAASAYEAACRYGDPDLPGHLSHIL